MLCNKMLGFSVFFLLGMRFTLNKKKNNITMDATRREFGLAKLRLHDNNPVHTLTLCNLWLHLGQNYLLTPTLPQHRGGENYHLLALAGPPDNTPFHSYGYCSAALGGGGQTQDSSVQQSTASSICAFGSRGKE